MRLVILAVKDRATDEFGTPMFLVTINQGIRSFTDEANRQDAQNQIYQHPEDFDLYKIGEYETKTGKIENTEIQIINRAQDVKQK